MDRKRGAKTMRLMLSGALCLAWPLSGQAQKSASGRPSPARRDVSSPVAAADNAAQNSPLGDVVALVPWSYRNGKDPAIQSAREICNQLLLETGFNVFLIKPPNGAMPPAMPGSSASRQPVSPFTHILDQGRALLGQEESNKANSPYVMPTVDELAEIGAKTGARYVVAGRAAWTSRNVWVGIANRVKATCTVDIEILDMADRHLALDAKNVVGDSTENKNPFNSITSVISLNPLPLVLPGSVTPQQQRAVIVAVARAMEPWLKTERIKTALHQADESGAAATVAGRPTPKFSTLVTSLTDLQAMLHVTTPDQQLNALDRDLVRLGALHDVTLQYKEPNRLRLSAISPKDGQEALVINEVNRSFVVPDHRSVHTEDVSSAPERRLSLLDCCGLLTPGMFDYLRARYVREEKFKGANCVVYDLTYWGVIDGPYHRVWIDPEKRVVLKRELYDYSGKLKVVSQYGQFSQATPRLWLPAHVEIQNGNQKILASLNLSDIRLDQGISDAPFSVESPKKVAGNRP